MLLSFSAGFVIALLIAGTVYVFHKRAQVNSVPGKQVYYTWVLEGDVMDPTQPDLWNRWAAVCYMHVNIENALPQYGWYEQNYHSDYIRVCVARINRKGTEPGNVPSLVHEYAASCLSFKDCANLGMSERYFFDNDLQDLQQQIEAELNQAKLVFDNVKMK